MRYQKLASTVQDKYNEVSLHVDIDTDNPSKEMVHHIYSIADVLIDPDRELFSSESEYDDYIREIDKENLNFIKSLFGEESPIVDIAKYIFENGY